MPEENTERLSRKADEESIGHSHFMRVSIRGWLAIILVGTVCLHSVAAIALALMTKQPELLKVTEPLYTMGGMALAYYFGQQNKQKQ